MKQTIHFGVSLFFGNTHIFESNPPGYLNTAENGRDAWDLPLQDAASSHDMMTCLGEIGIPIILGGKVGRSKGMMEMFIFYKIQDAYVTYV